jgi:hypothetical protein
MPRQHYEEHLPFYYFLLDKSKYSNKVQLNVFDIIIQIIFNPQVVDILRTINLDLSYYHMF